MELLSVIDEDGQPRVFSGDADVVRRLSELLSDEDKLANIDQLRNRLTKHIRMLETQTSTLLQTQLSQGPSASSRSCCTNSRYLVG